MRLYAISTRILAIITVFSGLAIFVLHYKCSQSDEISFWINVALAIFGSSLLSLITSLIGYFQEKKMTLERFNTLVINLLRMYNKYNKEWGYQEKVEFLIEAYDFDASELDHTFLNIYFLSEIKQQTHAMLWNNIYMPIVEVTKEISNFEAHLRLDGKEENMKRYVSQIEELLIDWRFVDNVKNNLDLFYQKYILGKRKTEKLKKELKNYHG